MFWESVGISAAVLTMSAFLPQLVKVARSKSAKDVSILTLAQMGLGVALWVAYGAHLRDPIIIAANLITLVSIAVLLLLCLRYGGK
jgi:MtN3 and saliva related transmembrane protein